VCFKCVYTENYLVHAFKETYYILSYMFFSRRGLNSPGQGLGKNGSGRAEPIKVKIKRDNRGVSNNIHGMYMSMR